VRYVVPPEVGSMHTRGVAVDLTLADEDGAPQKPNAGGSHEQSHGTQTGR